MKFRKKPDTNNNDDEAHYIFVEETLKDFLIKTIKADRERIVKELEENRIKSKQKLSGIGASYNQALTLAQRIVKGEK